MKIDCIKKIAVILAVLSFGYSAAFAESASDPNAPAPHRRGPAAQRQGQVRDYLQELSEKLNLTDTQKDLIKPILAAEANEIRTVRTDSSLSGEQKMAKIKEIRESSREKIKAVLTPEQQKIFAEMKDQASERMRERFQSRLAMLAEQLSLTDAQKAAIDPILTAEANDIKAVAQDSSTTPEQKRAKISEIRDASDKKINALLTPEQQAKWAKIKENAKQRRENNTQSK